MVPADSCFLRLHVEIVERLDLGRLEKAIIILIKEALEIVIVLAPSPELASIVNGNSAVSVD